MMFDDKNNAFRPFDVRERIGGERMIEASLAVNNAMVDAIRDYCLRRAERELAELATHPKIVREGDASDDMLYRTGFIAGLMAAAHVPSVIVDSVQKAREKQHER